MSKPLTLSVMEPIVSMRRAGAAAAASAAACSRFSLILSTSPFLKGSWPSWSTPTACSKCSMLFTPPRTKACAAAPTPAPSARLYLARKASARSWAARSAASCGRSHVVWFVVSWT